MALEIKEDGGLFEIRGRVTSQNLDALKVYFDSVLEQQDNIIVSMERVAELDTSAAFFFETLYRQAAVGNKAIAIIGRHNDAVTRVMQAVKTDYILSADRI